MDLFKELENFPRVGRYPVVFYSDVRQSLEYYSRSGKMGLYIAGDGLHIRTVLGVEYLSIAFDTDGKVIRNGVISNAYGRLVNVFLTLSRRK